MNKGGVIVLVVGEQDAATEYAYINAFKVSTDGWDTSKKTVEVKAVLADGTQKTYTLVDDDSAANSSSLKELAVATAAVDPDDLNDLKAVYKYTVNKDGNLVVKASDVVTTTGTAAFKTGKPALTTATGASAVFVDSNTVVLYVYEDNDDKQQAVSYTGIDNIPNIETGTITYSLKGTTRFAEFALVTAAPEKVQSTAKYAYAYTSSTALVANGKEVKVVINGAIETLVIDKTATVDANKMYTYTTDSDGISTLSHTAANAVNAYTKIATVGSNYVIDTAGNIIYLDKDATVDDLTSYDDDDNLVAHTGTLAKDVTIIYTKVGGSGTNKDYIAKAYIVPVPAITGVTIEYIDGTFYASTQGVEGGKVSYQWKVGTTNVGTDDSSYKTAVVGSYTVVATVTSQLDSAKTVTVTSAAVVLPIT